jgi:hypothetical protein
MILSCHLIWNERTFNRQYISPVIAYTCHVSISNAQASSLLPNRALSESRVILNLDTTTYSSLKGNLTGCYKVLIYLESKGF